MHDLEERKRCGPLSVIDTFGAHIEKTSDTAPDKARNLLKTGWQLQHLKLKLMPDKRLLPADQYLAKIMMDTMLKPLKDPNRSVIVSIFTPCELMQEVGLYPYNVEAFSAFLNGTHAENSFLRQAESRGLSETLCSYHKAFIGAAQKGLLWWCVKRSRHIALWIVKAALSEQRVITRNFTARWKGCFKSKMMQHKACGTHQEYSLRRCF